MTATVQIDETGRLFLPKSICDEMHLGPGSKLNAKVVGERIELTQEVLPWQLVTGSDGLPVVLGWDGYDAAEAVREMRAQQDVQRDPLGRK